MWSHIVTKTNKNVYLMHVTLLLPTRFINKNLVYLRDLSLAEFLESGLFKYIIPNAACYFRYIDDILLIYPQDLDFHSITDRLNNVEPSIKFTYQLGSNNALPFLDILLIRDINKLEFKVYHKPTCKNDHIHFSSHHNNNTKKGFIKGFYLRTLHICSPKYLNDEFNHIENSFFNLL